MCEPGEVPIDRVRLKYLTEIESMVDKIYAIWSKSPNETDDDEIELAEVMDRLMLLVGLANDEEDWD